MRCPVVRRLDLVRFAVRELPLDHVGIEAQFVQERRGGCPEPMPGHLVFAITKSAQGRVDRVI